MNVGEEICADWLVHVAGCSFVQKNVPLPDEQGEVDVVGIDLTERIVYACESAIHLTVGLQYTKNAQPNNVEKLCEKFGRDIRFVRKAFPKDMKYSHRFMLWSPVVRDQRKDSKHNQLRDVQEVCRLIKCDLEEDIVPVINAEYLKKLDELRAFASRETQELKSPILRLMQLEALAKKHVEKLNKSVAR